MHKIFGIWGIILADFECEDWKVFCFENIWDQIGKFPFYIIVLWHEFDLIMFV